MKRTRKGFTLIELLIVIAIMAALAAMMAISSSESIDNASASAILNNLQTMKAAAFEMYMQEPKAASLGAFALNDVTTTIVARPTDEEDDDRSPDDKKTPNELLASKYLGKATLGTKYSLIGSAKHWYVVYTMDTEDSTAVRSRLATKAEEAGLYGTTEAPSKTSENCGFTADYTNGEDAGATVYIALQVR